jgi:hypothetical protein
MKAAALILSNGFCRFLSEFSKKNAGEPDQNRFDSDVRH